MAEKAFTGRLTVDPITRIEGHLRIDVEVKDGVIANSWSSAQLFRGLEMIVLGRPPEDVHHYVQRACGVCTNSHSLASIRAVENAVGVKPPPAAELVRHLILAMLNIHDHLVHFYHLNALDYFDMASALKADPVAAAKLATQVSGREVQPGDYFVVQSKLKKFVESGQLGWLTNAYFLGGHPSYRLTPEEDLILAANYLEGLRVQVKLARAWAIFAGKNPHAQTLQVGGVTCYESLKPERLAEFKALYDECVPFLKHNYMGDLVLLGRRYPEACVYGRTTNFMDFSDFHDAETGKNPAFRGGVMWKRNLKHVEEFDPAALKEDVTRSWYKGAEARHPYEGRTEPVPGDFDPAGKYSWVKAPRYKGESIETGPLARQAMAFARGEKASVGFMNAWLSGCNLKPENMFSTLGRTAARMVETQVLADLVPVWLNDLTARAKHPDVEIYRPWKMPDKAKGVGYVVAPRGGLSHWIRIEGGKTANYQMVVPSTWNLGPRCAAGKLSAVEECLVGNPIADPERPVEILRSVHSYDPCIACAVHVIHAGGKKSFKVL